MSDGPHRSLPMSKAWKKVAEWADNQNFDIQQVCDRLFKTLVKDARKQLSAAVIDVVHHAFQESSSDLFPDQRLHDLSNARRLAAGFPFATSFLDCAEQELSNGVVGNEGLFNSVKSVLEERMQRAARQIEEHYLRDHTSSRERADIVKTRLNSAINQISIEDLSQRVLRTASRPFAATPGRGGLDDGVPIND